MIRFAGPGDAEAMIAIEVAAGEQFRALGMDAVADDDPGSPDSLAAVLGLGVGWVAVDDADRPIAYLLLQRMETRGFVVQVTVHPSHSRRGIGASLIETADAWALSEGLRGLTLTTFADVPWNAPYYSRLGFTVLREDRWSPAMRMRVLAEAANGLDAWPRVVMTRDSVA